MSNSVVPFERVSPTSGINSKELNRLFATVEQFSQFTGDGVTVGDGGVNIRSPQEFGFWAKLTARSTSTTPAAYSWTRLQEVDAGVLTNDERGFVGTATDLPAYEANDANVPINTVVWMWRLSSDSFLRFAYEVGGSITIQEEGSNLTQRSKLNFIGSGFTAADDSGNARTNVTLHLASISQVGVVGLGDQVLGTGKKTVDELFSNARVSGNFYVIADSTAPTSIATDYAYLNYLGSSGVDSVLLFGFQDVSPTSNFYPLWIYGQNSYLPRSATPDTSKIYTSGMFVTCNCFGWTDGTTEFAGLTTSFAMGESGTFKGGILTSKSGSSSAGGDLGGTYPSPIVMGASTSFALSGDISPPALGGGSTNDYNPTNLATSSVIRISSSAAATLTGLQGGADGRVVVLHNSGTFPIAISSQNAGSAAANRFSLPVSSITLQPEQSMMLQYDSTTGRYRAVGSAGLTEDSSIAVLASRIFFGG